MRTEKLAAVEYIQSFKRCQEYCHTLAGMILENVIWRSAYKAFSSGTVLRTGKLVTLKFIISSHRTIPGMIYTENWKLCYYKVHTASKVVGRAKKTGFNLWEYTVFSPQFDCATKQISVCSDAQLLSPAYDKSPPEHLKRHPLPLTVVVEPMRLKYFRLIKYWL